MNTPMTSPEQSTTQSAERPLDFWLRTVDHAIKHSMHEALAEDGLGRRSWRTLELIASGAASVDEIDAALPPHRRGPRGPERFGRRGGFGPGRGFGRPERTAETTADTAPEERPSDHEHGHPAHDRAFGRGREFGRGFGRDHRSGGAPFGPGHGHHRGPRRSTADIVIDFAARGWVIVDADGITLTDTGREAHDALRTKVDAVRQTVADAVSPEDLATTLASLESIARAFGQDEHTAHEHGPRGRFGRGPRSER
ncbi:hypothetical protein SAMN06295974_2299 [Plantibacter flavus]|uniref:MarR family transcriptional regulator n=1 Tax=Plantibacter flavus TaxID=150123 RepID=A0A3N2BZ73_9MICO|nr:hypothetical protein [Plantibacter flavus]ROR80537.1 hypothetical protein EDD42_0578 [Plantibacter flavus]SMG33488.1 hypothetical protein SAMN06295974_2299 [Plantibacter flavus]